MQIPVINLNKTCHGPVVYQTALAEEGVGIYPTAVG